MTEHQRSLQARAAKILGREDGKPASHTETLRAVKRFLKVEEHRILLAHRAGGGGVAICKMRTDLVDVVVRFLWQATLSSKDDAAPKAMPISVVATGGYGRGIMNPHSDVDLLFLYPKNRAVVTAEATEVISEFLLYLYDLRFKVGHATRSVGECFKLANEDTETKTALIESRLVTGKPEAYEEFQRRFDKECMLGREAQFLKLRQEDIASRHEKHEGTPFVQEPNVKTGCGGLRDYQSILWVAYAKLRTTSLKSLRDAELINRKGWRELEHAYDFLLRVRNEMHYSERRASDQLTLRLQGTVATNLGYRHKRILHRIEAFMRDYYTCTRDMLQRSSEVMDRFHLLEVEEKSNRRSPLGFLARRHQARQERFDGFVSKNERIYAEQNNIFKEDPARLMRLFKHTQQRHLRLSPELFQLVQDNFRLVNSSFRYNKAIRETFDSILAQKGDVGRVLRQMHRTGFLGKYIPEFGSLTCLVQHEFFHRYTADEHTLRTIDRLEEFSGTMKDGAQDFYNHLFHELQEPGILYLALLMHDTGRSANSRTHARESTEMADAVARRLQIKGPRRGLLLFLVDNHLLLYRTATAKSLEDPSVIEEFASIVRSKQHLDALLLMTVADSKGTSEQSWNGYKEASVRQLYHATLMCLDAPADFMKSAFAPMDELTAEVRKSLDASYEAEIKAHFLNMPRSYFNFRDAQTINAHIKQFRKFFTRLASDDPNAALLPVMTWADHPEQGYSKLVVTCWDRHLLLARVAGALAAENINILGADLFQRADNLVLDIFRVCTTNFTAVTSERARKRIEDSVNEAFSTESFDFGKRITSRQKTVPGMAEVMAEIPQRVHINNAISAEHTVIELQAVDRLGLLYDVFMTIGKLGYNVSHARINTEKGAAIDSIYVQDNAAKKIRDRDATHDLRRQLEQAVFG